MFYYPRVNFFFIFAVNVQKDPEENNEARPNVTESKEHYFNDNWNNDFIYSYIYSFSGK